MGPPQKVAWAKMICQNVAPPKCIFIIWLLLHEKLVTCSSLQRIGIQVDQVCCLCGKADEALEHMFFECEYVQVIWTDVMDWCGLQMQAGKWCLEKERLITQCTNNNGKQRLYRCAITILVYHIWSERNQMRFQGKKRSGEDISKQCKYLLAWCCQRWRL